MSGYFGLPWGPLLIVVGMVVLLAGVLLRWLLVIVAIALLAAGAYLLLTGIPGPF
jgi:hypothetical protein